MRGPVQVQNIAALAAFPADNGSLVYVQSVRCLWNFLEGSTLTTDGITIVNGNGGRWLRRSIPDWSWAYQASWFCNPSSGNDENDGSTSGTAIKTLAELDRRLSAQMVQQTTTVSLMGSYASEYFRLRDVRIALNPTNAGGAGPFRLIVQGDSSAFTNVFTSNVAGITSFQTVTRVAAGVRYAVTDNNLGGTDPATFIGHRIRLTTGANTGATSWVLKKLSATQFATGPFITAVVASTTGGTGTLITPAAGDRYVIEDVVGVKGIEIIDGIARYDLRDGTATTSLITPVLVNLDIGQGGTTATAVADSNLIAPTPVPGVVGVTRTTIMASRIASSVVILGSGNITGCLFACPSQIDVSAGRIDASCFLTIGAAVGAATNAVIHGPVAVQGPSLVNDLTSQGVSLALQGAAGTLVFGSGIGLYDCVGIPITIRPGFTLIASVAIYGTNPTCTGGCAMRIQSGATLRTTVTTVPVITAATPGTDDVQYNDGNVTSPWTSAPITLPGEGQAIIDNTANFGRKYLTNISGNQGSAGIFVAAPNKGLYSLDLYLAVTTAGNGGDTLTVAVTWTDDSQAETVNVFNAVSVGAKGFFQARRLLETNGAVNPAFSMTFTKTGAPVVSIRIVARLLQNVAA